MYVADYKKQFRLNSTKFTFKPLRPTEISTYIANVSNWEALLWKRANSNIESKEYLKTTEVDKIIWENARSNLELNVTREYLITVIANYGVFEFVLNLIISLKLNKFEKFLIICLDVKLYEKLIEYGLIEHATLVPSSWIPNPVSSTETKWSTKEYNQVTHTKTFIVYKLLQKGYNVVFTDVDIVWLSPHIVQYLDFIAPDKDLVYSLDIIDMNTGFYLARPTTRLKRILWKIIQAEKATEQEKPNKFGQINKNDQDVTNQVINHYYSYWKMKHAYGLDKLLFPNGMFYYLKGLNRQFEIQPMIFHANYMIGLERKKRALKEENMWYL